MHWNAARAIACKSRVRLMTTGPCCWEETPLDSANASACQRASDPRQRGVSPPMRTPPSHLGASRLRLALLVFALAGISSSVFALASAARPVRSSACGIAFVFSNPIGPSIYQQQVAKGLARARTKLKLKIDQVEATDEASILTN